jgi:Uma2 family endonuclease
MTVETSKLLTADEFFAFVNRPENRDRCFELVRGEVVEMPQPGERHGAVCANVTRILGNYTFQRRKGFVCSNDTGVLVEQAPDTVRGPDVVLFDELRRYDQLNPKFTQLIPRLAVEVLSPEDRMNKVLQRVDQFFRFGVSLVWVVDPEDRTVAIHRPGEFPRILEENEELTGNDQLPEFRCRVADFFFMPGEEPVPATSPPTPTASEARET